MTLVHKRHFSCSKKLRDMSDTPSAQVGEVDTPNGRLGEPTLFGNGALAVGIKLSRRGGEGPSEIRLILKQALRYPDPSLMNAPADPVSDRQGPLIGGPPHQ